MCSCYLELDPRRRCRKVHLAITSKLVELNSISTGGEKVPARTTVFSGRGSHRRASLTFVAAQGPDVQAPENEPIRRGIEHADFNLSTLNA
jgi:hypothetical protein